MPAPSRLCSFCAACFAVLALLCAAPVSAQPFGKTIVVPLGAPDAREAFVVADSLESALQLKQVTVVSMHDARDRFLAHSRPPLTASDSDLDVLAREARQAIEHAAFGRTVAAQKSVREVMTRAERSLESLNRETVRARQLLDACLALVRSQLHAKRREEALDQATACRRLVPDLAPSEAAHPPNVIGVLAEADDLMRRMRLGRLTVRSMPDEACSVFLNGRHLGTTPFVLDRAAAGEYRVQVECNSGPPGRVHVVQLGDQPVALAVDSEFDRAVASEPRLILSYPSEALLQKRAVRDAVRLGEESRADDVVLVRMRGDQAELLRVNMRQARLVGRAPLLLSDDEGERKASWMVAMATLSEARLQGTPSVVAPEPSDEPVSTQPLQAAQPVAARPARPARPRPQARRRTGFAMAGVAGALFLTGLALELRSQGLQNELVSSSDPALLQDENRRYDRLTSASWLGVAAGPVGILAGVLTVGPQTRVPWWSYVLGGVGVGLAGVAIYELASADQCKLHAEDGSCLVARNSETRGAILLSASLPLLSVPLLHLWKLKQTTQLQVSSTPLYGGALLTGHVRF